MAVVTLTENTSRAPRASQRQSNKRKTECVEDELSEKRYRECEKTGCSADIPLCFLTATERCAGNGYTSRWYHMSHGEHFCNECFDFYYRSSKDGYAIFNSWKDAWMDEATSEPTLKTFVSDQLLPYWVCCTLCKKWRQLPKNSQVAPDFIKKFHCKSFGQKNPDPCSIPEDERVAEVLEPCWVDYNVQTPLLKFSPAAVYLHHFYPEGIGLSPTSCKTSYITKSKWLKPFSQELSGKSPLFMDPDSIELEEERELPGCASFQSTYLGLRNLILTVWNSFPKVWLTIDELSAHVICRGLVRIYLLHEAERILNYLTWKGVINYGLVQSPQGYSLIPENSENEVLVVGAGTAGLSAARHLQNLGVKVKVLEATSRLFGRVCDANEYKSLSGKGAQIANGICNNPFTIMCSQAEIPMKLLRNKLYLINDKGKSIPDSVSDRMHFHFNALLDTAEDWGEKHQEDISIFDKIIELHEEFKKDTGIQFSEEEENIFYLYANLLANSTGIPLHQTSVVNWDQSIVLSQISGPDALITGGYSAVLSRLAEGINIQMECEVKAIKYDKCDIEVSTTKGIFKPSKVLLTVPLAVLRCGTIDFQPPLPEAKQSAFQQLGDSYFEKVIMQFPSKFWETVTKEADVFGYVTSSVNKSAQFCIFYDVSSATKENVPTLMTYICSSPCDTVQDESAEIIEKCVCNLSDMFSEMLSKQGKNVPSPDKWFVTHWNSNPYARSSGSFLKVGSKCQPYDDLAKDIDTKLYFAGEATHRQLPHSMAGAYLSGLRETTNIVNDIIKNSAEMYD